MLPFNIDTDKIIKYIIFHSSELVALGVVFLIYLLIRRKLKSKLSSLLDKIPEKGRSYLGILSVFYSFPFFFIVFSYILRPFLKTKDIFSFLLPIFWALFIFYVLNYILIIFGIYKRIPFLKKILFFVVSVILFYYYLSKPVASPAYWLLYPLFSIGGRSISVITLIIVTIFFYLTVYFAKFTRDIIFKRLRKDLHLEESRAYNLSVIWEYFIFTLGFIIVLNIMGIKLSSLLIIAGSLGIGIGFGLQTIINNFISGLVLLTDRSINVGDIVTVDNNMGKVVLIGARYTIIQTFDDQDLLIPNYKFMETNVINWTRSGLRLRVHIPFSISYNSDPEEASKIVLDLAKSYPKVMPYPPPEVLFLEFGQSSLNFELRIWIPDLTQGVINIKSEFNYLIFKAFKEHGIEIPYPQIDVHIKDEKISQKFN